MQLLGEGHVTADVMTGGDPSTLAVAAGLMASLWHQAEAEDLAGKHAWELRHLKGSLDEAQWALSCAQDEQAAAQTRSSEQARELPQHHEQLTQKLLAQHKQEMQVRPGIYLHADCILYFA